MPYQSPVPDGTGDPNAPSCVPKLAGKDGEEGHDSREDTEAPESKQGPASSLVEALHLPL